VTTAPDGSPIDLYLRLPSFGEGERIHELIPAGADVLELGCGVGRVTHQLVRLGHPVTAVDESDDMLMHVRGAEVVRARIEELDLGRRFACVLLMSQLVNVPEGHRSERGGVAFTLERVRVDGPSVTATVRYEIDGKTWRHPFLARLLNDEELDRELALAGLRRRRVLGDRQAWVEARLYSAA
jgi:SAM-dependent methyltransferase